MDKTKFGKSSLVTVCDMDDITTMITNEDDGTIRKEMAHFNGKLVLV
ncbi:hypothetical protein [uncultured Brevibacillus sp.]|nr:hypothetical protein [uncultured Brevibacillus sp.]